VLLIRFYLHLANYPKVGGESLHIAHMLWGGLLMLAALVIAVGWLGRPARRAAALIGGLGFGTFIDELGKFITHDNDYFYQPTVALLYGIFVLLYLGLRALRKGEVDHRTALANALQEVESAALGDLDRHERARALALLDHCDRSDPLVAPLRTALLRSDLVEAPAPDLFDRIRTWSEVSYRRAVGLPGFDRALVIFFVAQLAVRVVYVLAAFVRGEVGAPSVGRWSWFDPTIVDAPDGMAAWFQLASVSLAAVLVVVGIVRLRRGRAAAYRWLQRSVLVSIFLTQPFVFYRDEWAGLGGLLFSILLYLALRFASERERAPQSA
jgi:hypothetical protein